jgi:hypothetical protein
MIEFMIFLLNKNYIIKNKFFFVFPLVIMKTMANINNNFLLNNIFLFLGQSPKNINLLDNFSTLSYKGIYLPRIGLNQFIDKNKNQKESHVSEKSKETKINDADSTDIVIPIKKEENDPENKELKNEKQKSSISGDIKDLFSKEGNESLFTKNYKQEIEKILEEIKDITLIPPKRIISIIIDGKGDEGNESQKKNYEIINNILLDNISPIRAHQNQTNNIQKRISFPTIMNINNFPTNLNPNLNLGNNQINLKNSPIFLNPNLNKQVFLPSPENTKTLNEKKRFRGRKGIQENNLDKRIHSASDDDNVLRKIQVHYLTFLVNFTNDVIKTFIEDKNVPQFKNLDYKFKKIVKHKVVEDLKSKTIGEILQSRISPKMKTYESFANNNIYNDICNRSPLIKEFLQTQYIKLFKEYYNNKDKKFEVNGKIIQLSPKTKTYNDLILKNYQYKDKIKYVTTTYFLNSYKRRKKPNFMTYTYEK